MKDQSNGFRVLIEGSDGPVGTLELVVPTADVNSAVLNCIANVVPRLRKLPNAIDNIAIATPLRSFDAQMSMHSPKILFLTFESSDAAQMRLPTMLSPSTELCYVINLQTIRINENGPNLIEADAYNPELILKYAMDPMTHAIEVLGETEIQSITGTVDMSVKTQPFLSALEAAIDDNISSDDTNDNVREQRFIDELNSLRSGYEVNEEATNDRNSVPSETKRTTRANLLELGDMLEGMVPASEYNPTLTNKTPIDLPPEKFELLKATVKSAALYSLLKHWDKPIRDVLEGFLRILADLRKVLAVAAGIPVKPVIVLLDKTSEGLKAALREIEGSDQSNDTKD